MLQVYFTVFDLSFLQNLKSNQEVNSLISNVMYKRILNVTVSTEMLCLIKPQLAECG